ncbi:MAG: 4-hydroxy-3-methylbut-2-enyl diphosphate reductase [Xanthomonadales bacterium]|nr:4-hydroxy-3-methylbut-2-enyl diphosphate reductase [Xanthomonadales bacterium]
MEVLLARPRGFCAGVDRAIAIVERCLESFGAPVYVRHEVVHNRYVVEGLRRRGAVFVENLAEVPEGAILVFSAHGVSQAVRAEARARRLTVFDATCPLVTKVHIEVQRHLREGRDLVLVGHAGHPEVEGTLGQWDPERARGRAYLVESVAEVESLEVGQPGHIAYVTQTTLSVEDTRAIVAALTRRFPAIVGPKRDDICYATQNRQDAVARLAALCELVLVVGSRNSSNSNRLRELAEKRGVPARLIDGPGDIDPAWLAGRRRVGLTAGASAPETLVQEVVRFLRAHGATSVRELEGVDEDVAFPLPRELRGLAVG